MSRENVELVRALQPAPEVDLVQLFKDDVTATPLLEAVAPVFSADFECSVRTPVGGSSGAGLDGLRAIWLEWLQPWATYRTEIEELIDAGDRTVVLIRDYGRRTSSEPEVALLGASVWTVREGKVARAEFYANRAEALEAAGVTR